MLSPEWDIYIKFLLPETWGHHGRQGRKIIELEIVNDSKHSPAEVAEQLHRGMPMVGTAHTLQKLKLGEGSLYHQPALQS